MSIADVELAVAEIRLALVLSPQAWDLFYTEVVEIFGRSGNGDTSSSGSL